jgi:hypothetical protein
MSLVRGVGGGRAARGQAPCMLGRGLGRVEGGRGGGGSVEHGTTGERGGVGEARAGGRGQRGGREEGCSRTSGNVSVHVARCSIGVLCMGE